MHIDPFLAALVDHDGTDLYITVDAPPKMTVEGAFIAVGESSLSAGDVDALVNELIDDRVAFERNPEVDVALRTPDGERFRLNIYRQRGCCAVVARRVRAKIQPLERLGLPPQLAGMSLAKNGLVLVTGACGSGKSTTLAALIDHRNRNAAGHIVTIEDPIEFIYEHKRSLISQREIGTDTMSFSDALRSALRQAPNVLSIGEIRDRETAEAALKFAETGHLVLGTLHAVNTSQSLERITSLFPADAQEHLRMLLGLNLRGLVSQRLVPTVSGSRQLVLEILVPTARIRDLVRRGNFAAVREAIASDPTGQMQTFDQCLGDLVRAGEIREDDALGAADSPHDLLLTLGRDRATNDEEIQLLP